MKLTCFSHEPLDSETAEELPSRYAARNIKTQKILATDPRMWIVSALLPEFEREPRKDRTFENKIWS